MPSSPKKNPAWLESLMFHGARDLKEGRITPEQMEELMQSLFKGIQDHGELLK